MRHDRYDSRLKRRVTYECKCKESKRLHLIMWVAVLLVIAIRHYIQIFSILLNEREWSSDSESQDELRWAKACQGAVAPILWASFCKHGTTVSEDMAEHTCFCPFCPYDPARGTTPTKMGNLHAFWILLAHAFWNLHPQCFALRKCRQWTCEHGWKANNANKCSQDMASVMLL